MALKKLDDPVYAERFIEDFIRAAIGQSSGSPGDDEAGHRTVHEDEYDLIQRTIDKLDSIEALKERLGIPSGRSGRSWIDCLKDPGVIVGILNAAKLIVSGQSPAPSRTYVGCIDGEVREVTGVLFINKSGDFRYIMHNYVPDAAGYPKPVS